ncbi:MAG: hypothetical protein F6J87_23585 [Spirulina sp. SIO3F2]|nr:hypothetical protein [Spirulina sp. SIO3F2]
MFKLPKTVAIAQSAALKAIATLSLSLLPLLTAPAFARDIGYRFTVTVTGGSLAGNTFEGVLVYDDATLTGAGTETLTVDAENGDLRVIMELLGQFYTEAEDVDAPNFPQLVFEDGEIQQLDFWLESGPRVNWWALPGWEVELEPWGASTSDTAQSAIAP